MKARGKDSENGLPIMESLDGNVAKKNDVFNQTKDVIHRKQTGKIIKLK